jgi:hypothetical protein
MLSVREAVSAAITAVLVQAFFLSGNSGDSFKHEAHSIGTVSYLDFHSFTINIDHSDQF